MVKQIKSIVRTARYSEFLERNQLVAPTFGLDGRIYYPEFAKNKDPWRRAALSLINFVSAKLVDGTDRRVHVIFPFADEATVSPDLNTLAFQEGDNVYTLAFPSAGNRRKTSTHRQTGAVLPLNQVSKEGGNFPHFRDAQTLEFGSANKYFVYHLDSKKTDTTEIKLSVPREIPSGSLALTHARILTFAQRKVLQRGAIVVKGPRISCVGDCSPAGVDRVIDVSGRPSSPASSTCMRTTTACTTASHLPTITRSPATWPTASRLTFDPAAWSQNVLRPAEKRSTPALMIGPRTFSCGDPLYAGNGSRNNDLTSLEVTEENIKRLSSYGVFTLKQYLQPKREQHQWVAEVARKYGLNITAEGGGLEYDLGMAMDGQTGSEHPLGYAPLYSDATKFFGMAHFTYSPTAIVGGPGVWNEEYFFQTFDYYKDAKLLRWTP